MLRLVILKRDNTSSKTSPQLNEVTKQPGNPPVTRPVADYKAEPVDEMLHHGKYEICGLKASSIALGYSEQFCRKMRQRADIGKLLVRGPRLSRVSTTVLKAAWAKALLRK
jgi:hypothetical protein